MTPFKDLVSEAKEIYEFMDVPIGDDIAEATEKGNLLSVYINRTGHMLAEAKYYLNEAMNSEIVQIIQKMVSAQYSAKVQNALIDSVCREQRMLVDEIEQLNKTAKYQIEWCRTIISKIKEEMKYNNFST